MEAGGRLCDSYKWPELRGQGPSTASQTAWAIMGLLAGGEEKSPEVSKGIQYLLRNQNPDGTWDEIDFTGTGFSKAFLYKVSQLPELFPADGAGSVYEEAEAVEGRLAGPLLRIEEDERLRNRSYHGQRPREMG